MFQRNFMIPLPPRAPGIKSYMYKTCTVCASVMPPRAALEMPMRTVSICDHTGKSTIPQEELHGILEFCGMNLSLPIHRQTVKHVGIPSFGDSQYNAFLEAFISSYNTLASRMMMPKITECHLG